MTTPPESVGVIVTLPEIYRKVEETDQKVDKLATAVSQMVAVNKRLDEHRDEAKEHGERLRKVESQVAAQWIVVGITVTAIGALVAAALINR